MESTVIHIRIPVDVKTTFATLAAEMNYPTPSALVRTLMTEALTKYPSLDASRLRLIRDLIYQLRSIGVNINQMAHIMNMEGRPSDDRILQSMADVYDLLRDTLAAYDKLIKSSRKRLVKAAK